MEEYLKQHNLKDIEDIAKHIEELKRNTVPNLELISSLCSYIFEGEKHFNDRIKEAIPFFEGAIVGVLEKEYHKKQEEINTGVREQVLQDIKRGYSTRHKSQNGEAHPFRLDNLITNAKNCKNGNTCFCDGSCTVKKTIAPNNMTSSTTIEEVYRQGKKEEDGKLTYELDWEFIEQLANRMAKNKGKYEPYNWKKPIDVEKLKQSLLRHVIEIMKGNYSDDGRDFGHLESIALNASFINYQLKLNKS